MTNSIADVEQADVILVIGADPTENHTIIGGRIMQAKLNGAKLIVIDPREIRLAEIADVFLQPRLGTNVALINGLLHIIFEQSWENHPFLKERCEGLDHLKQHVKKYSPDIVEKITGIDKNRLFEAARLYSHANAAFLAYGMGITQYVSGTNNVIAVSNLVLSCGHIGRLGTGINPLRGQNNVQGACDMGCLPNVYPGYQNALDAGVQKKFNTAWGTTVPTAPGLTSLGMNKAAREGSFNAIMIFGEDPVVTDPDQNNVALGLKSMDFVVVVDLMMTETAKLADVILPAASFAEKDGTFTNCERRVQRIYKALEPPGEAKADWRILQLIAHKMEQGELMPWSSAEEVFNEMASLADEFSGMNYAKLQQHKGLQWPCNTQNPFGTPYLHSKQFPIGKAQLLPVNHTDIDESPDAEYPFYLTTTRVHYHYGCGSMTRKSPLLERETPDGILFMNPVDAQNLALIDHSPIGIRSRRGYIETRIILTQHLPEGIVAIPYHFKEAPSNQLTNNAQDPVTKMPELKACAVRIEPLPTEQIPKTIDELALENKDGEISYASL